MDFIRDLIPKVGAEHPEALSYSVACIATTNPVYLVFGLSCKQPEYVIRSSDSLLAKRAHEIGQILFDVAGDLVPEPLGIVKHNGASYSIERGVGGSPWFQVVSDYSSNLEWGWIRTRALDALSKLHASISTLETNNNVQENAAIQLSGVFSRFCEIEGQTSELLNLCMEKSIADLSDFQINRSIPQHGDYSLNNLMIGETKITVIDFEDFGMTQMPLYDAFTLALSLASSAPPGVHTSEQEELKHCVAGEAEELKLTTGTIRALFLYHLLMRLGDWSLGEKRKAYRKSLLSTLDRFVKDPDYYIPN